MTDAASRQESDPTSPANEFADLTLEISPQSLRANQISDAIDPDGTLPTVEVIGDPSARMSSGGSLIPQPSLIIYNGEIIGECTVVTHKDDHTRWLNGIRVNEKGKGFGTAAYIAVIQQAVRDGYDFRTHDFWQTEDSKKIWDKLVAAGVARVEEEFLTYTNGKSRGRYVVDAVK